MSWTLSPLRRRRQRGCRPGNRVFGPVLERLEPRLVLASAAASSGQFDGLLLAVNAQTLLTSANIIPSNAQTLPAPVLSVSDICVGSVDLGWTGTANDHYAVNRSTDGTNFVTIASVPASQTTFTDSG